MSAAWEEHGRIGPSGVYEDVRVVMEDGRLVAYFTAGPNFQDQRLVRCPMDTPYGPLLPDNVEQVQGLPDTHTRLYGGRVDPDRRIISAVWPGLPKCGMWLFTEKPYGMVKTLLIAPEDQTGYSIAACNPAVIEVDGQYEIYFEGRTETVYWNLFRATWQGGNDRPVVDKKPFLENGANPALFKYDGRLWLYHSRHSAYGFTTHVMSRSL